MAAAPGNENKRTLTMTGLTIRAMALIAPGAFLWTTFQLQAGQSSGGVTTAMDMVPGLIFVILLAFLTAVSYSELSGAFPDAGSGSSYYYAEAAFLEQERSAHYRLARLAKFVVGWTSHLYYWMYPGIMIAFMAILAVYVVGLLGLPLDALFAVGAAILLAALVGFIAYRGISGSTIAAVVVNSIQLTALLGFAMLAIAFHGQHKDIVYAHPDIASVLLPHSLTNVLFQATIAIVLLVGFESVTSMGGEAVNPKRDVRRAVLLALAIQGAIAYVIEYVAANLVVGDALVAGGAGSEATGYSAAAASSAPIGDIVRLIGDQMLGGTGVALVLIMALSVMIALIGTALACVNSGVRLTYAMGRDREVPAVLGMLHFRHATPHFAVVLLTIVSAVVAGYAVLSPDHLAQVVLASNAGVFLVYGMTNALVLIAFSGSRRKSLVRHVVIPVAGLAANLALIGAMAVMSVSAGGATQTDAMVALAIVVVWSLVGALWLLLNPATNRAAVLAGPQLAGPER